MHQGHHHTLTGRYLTLRVDATHVTSLLRTQRGACAALGPPSTTTHTRISLRQACVKCDCGAPGTKVCAGKNVTENGVLIMFGEFVCEF